MSTTSVVVSSPDASPLLAPMIHAHSRTPHIDQSPSASIGPTPQPSPSPGPSPSISPSHATASGISASGGPRRAIRIHTGDSLIAAETITPHTSRRGASAREQRSPSLLVTSHNHTQTLLTPHSAHYNGSSASGGGGQLGSAHFGSGPRGSMSNPVTPNADGSGTTEISITTTSAGGTTGKPMINSLATTQTASFSTPSPYPSTHTSTPHIVAIIGGSTPVPMTLAEKYSASFIKGSASAPSSGVRGPQTYSERKSGDRNVSGQQSTSLLPSLLQMPRSSSVSEQPSTRGGAGGYQHNSSKTPADSLNFTMAALKLAQQTQQQARANAAAAAMSGRSSSSHSSADATPPRMFVHHGGETVAGTSHEYEKVLGEVGERERRKRERKANGGSQNSISSSSSSTHSPQHAQSHLERQPSQTSPLVASVHAPTTSLRPSNRQVTSVAEETPAARSSHSSTTIGGNSSKLGAHSIIPVEVLPIDASSGDEIEIEMIARTGRGMSSDERDRTHGDVTSPHGRTRTTLPSHAAGGSAHPHSSRHRPLRNSSMLTLQDSNLSEVEQTYQYDPHTLFFTSSTLECEFRYSFLIQNCNSEQRRMKERGQIFWACSFLAALLFATIAPGLIIPSTDSAASPLSNSTIVKTVMVILASLALAAVFYSQRIKTRQMTWAQFGGRAPTSRTRKTSNAVNGIGDAGSGSNGSPSGSPPGSHGSGLGSSSGPFTNAPSFTFSPSALAPPFESLIMKSKSRRLLNAFLSNQPILATFFCLSGCVFACSTTLHPSGVSSSTTIIFLLMAYTMIDLFLFLHLSFSALVISVCYVVLSVTTRSSKEDWIATICECILIIVGALTLSYSAYYHELNLRLSFLSSKNRAANKHALQQETAELRNEVFSLVLEKFDIVDVSKEDVSYVDLSSPLERSMKLLQEMEKDRTLSKKHFDKIRQIIEQLSSSDDNIFRPHLNQIIGATHHGGGGGGGGGARPFGRGSAGSMRKTFGREPSRSYNGPSPHAMQNEPSQLHQPSTNSRPRIQLDEDTTKWLSGLVEDHIESDGSLLLDNGLNPNQHEFSTTQLARKLASPSHSSTLLSSEEEQTISVLTAQLEDWNFDVFEVCKLTKNRPLFFIGLILFRKNDLITKFNIDKEVLCNFLNTIESGYENDKPYHNSTHAADVTRSMHFFLHKGGLKSDLSDLEILACLLSSIIHDYQHPGVNGNFLMKTHHELSMIYNDKSILENMHLSTAFKELQKPELNILYNLKPQQHDALRKLIIEMVLATDLGQHFEIVGHFKNALPRLKNSPERTTDAGKLMILKMALKCCDIAHSAKAIDLHSKWSLRIIEEFYRQGDQELAAGIPVSPFMDRRSSNIPRAQLGFIDFLALPMFTLWTDYLGLPAETIPCLTQLKLNREYWQRKEQVGLPQQQMPHPILTPTAGTTPGVSALHPSTPSAQTPVPSSPYVTHHSPLHQLPRSYSTASTNSQPTLPSTSTISNASTLIAPPSLVGPPTLSGTSPGVSAPSSPVAPDETKVEHDQPVNDLPTTNPHTPTPLPQDQ